MSLRPKRIDFNILWTNLRQDIDAMLNMTKSTVSAMALHQSIYDLCNAVPTPYTQRLFDSLAEYLTQHCVTTSRRIMDSQGQIVDSYAREWTRYSTAVGYLSSVCQFLDKQRAIASPRVPVESVLALAFGCWKDYVLLRIRDESNDILRVIQTDRDSTINSATSPETPGSTAVKITVDSLVAIGATTMTANPFGLYVNYFETGFLKDTGRYYSIEATGCVNGMGVGGFMRRAVRRLESEAERCKRYNPSPASRTRLMKLCEKIWIMNTKGVLQTEFSHTILDDIANRQGDAKIAVGLMTRIGDVQPLLKGFEDYVAKKVKREEFFKAGAKEYVYGLRMMHEEWTRIVRSVFDGDLAFVEALDRAFVRVLNSGDVDACMLLCRFSDGVLKKGGKVAKDDGDLDLDGKLNVVITLFKYIQDKDVFQKHYSKMLAKRLVFNSSIGADAESGMIQRLGVSCGLEYTQRLSRMFNDMGTSVELTNAFTDSRFNKPHEYEFNVNVLTSGSWPLATSKSTFIMSKDLLEVRDSFTQFYMARHNGRKLNWEGVYSRVDVRTIGFARVYEINMGVFVYGVLDCVQNGSGLEECGLEAGEIDRILGTLREVGLILGEGWDVRVNDGFSHKKVRFKIAVTGGGDVKESKETRRVVGEDRKLYLQAAIVRVMKSRGRLSHTGLIGEVIEVLMGRFRPDLGVVKGCIEGLIEKEFIARSGDGYVYVS